jgi:cobalamin-dependent methionine synthase I
MRIKDRNFDFIIIGENVHTTRVVLRNGKLVTMNPDGVEAVQYTAVDGEKRYLPIPDKVKAGQDYQEGRVKHVKIAVLAGMKGEQEGVDYLHSMVHRQLAAGADFLDLNVDEVSFKLSDQKEAIAWLVRTVEPWSTVPLSIDSSNLEIIQAGLEACQGSSGRPMLNSASLERIDALDMAASLKLPVVVTAAGESGMPQDSDQRVENASRMVDAALGKGIPKSDIYVDALVFPISVDSQFGNHCLDAFRALRQLYGPEIHLTGGLSNVSFGLPARRLINDVFINLAVDAGADSGIVDPVVGKLDHVFSIDRQSRPYQLAGDMLLGRDRNCKNFLRAYRKGELEPAPSGAGFQPAEGF